MIDTAIRAAKEAEKIIMKYTDVEKSVRKKGEIDLVTKADIEAEKMIVSVIKEKYPDHGFILEEHDSTNHDAEYVWIIDPIDGTTSFSHNYPMFCISIACYKHMQPVLGVVRIPYLDELFVGHIDEGAYLNGKKISVSKISSLRESLVATGFPYTRLTSDKDNLARFSKMAKHAQGLRRSGSAAIDICYVACGRVDAYWEIGLKIMDTAAARVILEEAGGTYTDLDNNKVNESYENIAASNGLVHKELLHIIGD